MITTLTPRAPVTGAPHGKPRTTLRTLAVASPLTLVLAGSLTTARTATQASGPHPATAVATGTAVSPPRQDAGAPHQGSALAPARRPEQIPDPKAEPTRPPERLSPQPPADGRDAPDPAVVQAGDRWALFSTQVGYLNTPVAFSDDLRQWSQPVDALPELPPWAEWGRTWAPGILQRDDGFVLYFATRSRALGVQCIGAATARGVGHPYTSAAPEPPVCQPSLGGSIDPQPFVDNDGAAYLLWKSDANAIGGSPNSSPSAYNPTA